MAVIAVVLSHLLDWPTGGFAGVDVFFVISGYLLTAIILRDVAATGSISLRSFYARRIRRILPAAVVVLIAVSAAAFFAFNGPRAIATMWDAVSSFFLVANWNFALAGTDYFHAADAVSPLQHFWSLSVEEQFYLVWPVALACVLLILPVAVRKTAHARTVVGVLATTVIAASFAWAVVQSTGDATVAYFSTLTRAWEIALGALIAVLASQLVRIPAALGGLLSWLGLAGVVASFFLLTPSDPPFPGPGAALPVCGAALVIIGGMRGGAEAHLFPLTNPVSVFFGNISYSLYLWHFPVIVFAAVLLPGSTGLTLAIVVGAILVFSLTSYFLIEQPIHRSPWLRRYSETSGVPAKKQPASVQPQPVVTPAARAETRPAGWTPGQRYFPGATPRPVAPRVAPPQQVALENPTTPAAQDVPTVAISARENKRAAWSQWREKFGSQLGITAGGFAVALTALLLLTNSAMGGSLITPIGPTAVASADDATDPTPAIQAELAAATQATEWPDLNPSMDNAITNGSQTNPARTCFEPATAPNVDACTWGSSSAPHHMYLVGDSTAMAYAPAFKQIAESSSGNWRITTIGLYGCRFTDVLVENSGAGVMDACTQRKADIAAIVSADSPDLVVVSNAYTLGNTVAGQPLSVTDLVSSTQSELEQFNAAGRVLYLAPPPMGASLGSCYSPLTSPLNCLSGVDSTWTEYEMAMEVAAAASGDTSMSSLTFSCWENSCPAFAGGIPTKYDQTHMTAAYAQHIAPVIRWNLEQLGLMSTSAN